MYGKPPPPPVQQPPSDEPTQARTAEELAEAAYPKPPEPVQLDPVPAEVQELRDGVARRLYSAQDTFRDAIPDADEAQRAELAAQGITPRPGARPRPSCARLPPTSTSRRLTWRRCGSAPPWCATRSPM